MSPWRFRQFAERQILQQHDGLSIDYLSSMHGRQRVGKRQFDYFDG